MDNRVHQGAGIGAIARADLDVEIFSDAGSHPAHATDEFRIGQPAVRTGNDPMTPGVVVRRDWPPILLRGGTNLEGGCGKGVGVIGWEGSGGIGGLPRAAGPRLLACAYHPCDRDPTNSRQELGPAEKPQASSIFRAERPACGPEKRRPAR